MTHSGGKKHTNTGDKGQRYEITYVNHFEAKRHVFGWAESLKGADIYVQSINLHPTMESPMIRDRLVG